MAQAETTRYTPDEALLLAVKTVGRTHPDPKVLAVIDEIEVEIEERRKKNADAHGRKSKGRAKPGRQRATPETRQTA